MSKAPEFIPALTRLPRLSLPARSGFGVSRAALPLCLLLASLQGCAPVIVGGAVSGAYVSHDRRTAGNFIDDQSLRLAVAQHLGEAPVLTDAHVSVTVYNGKVLLTGEVGDEEQKVAATAITRSDPRVKSIANELVVSGVSSLASRASDVLLLGKAKAAMFNIPLRGFDVSRVKITVEAGVVFLMGLVTRDEADAATDVVRRLDGVAKVVRLFEYVAVAEDAIGPGQDEQGPPEEERDAR